MKSRLAWSATGKNDGYVIGLFGSANPIRDCAGDDFGNARQRLVPMLFD